MAAADQPFHDRQVRHALAGRRARLGCGARLGHRDGEGRRDHQDHPAADRPDPSDPYPSDRRCGRASPRSDRVAALCRRLPACLPSDALDDALDGLLVDDLGHDLVHDPRHARSPALPRQPSRNVFCLPRRPARRHRRPQPAISRHDSSEDLPGMRFFACGQLEAVMALFIK